MDREHRPTVPATLWVALLVLAEGACGGDVHRYEVLAGGSGGAAGEQILAGAAGRARGAYEAPHAPFVR